MSAADIYPPTWKLASSNENGGIRGIDLGKGDDPYKARFANGRVWLAEGWIELPSCTTYSRRVRRAGWSMSRKLGRPAVHLARRAEGGVWDLLG